MVFLKQQKNTFLEFNQNNIAKVCLRKDLWSKITLIYV